MDRNSITGLVLIFVIIAGSFYLMKPSEEEIKREGQLQDSLARARAGVENVVTDTAVTATPAIDSIMLSGPFGQAIAGEEKIVTLENEYIKANINTKG